MDLPPNYLKGLTPQLAALQAQLIRKSKAQYEATGKAKDRPKVDPTKKTPRSSHVVKFQNKYGFSVTDLPKVKKMFPDTDVATVLKKGVGAYMSSGSRPNVSIAQWKFARLASVLVGGKALKVDKDLVGPLSRAKIGTKISD